jgi:hypothetical protein
MPYRILALVAASVLTLSSSALAQFNLPGIGGSNTSDRMGGGGGGKGAAGVTTVKGSKSNSSDRMGGGGGGKGAGQSRKGYGYGVRRGG